MSAIFFPRMLKENKDGDLKVRVHIFPSFPLGFPNTHDYYGITRSQSDFPEGRYIYKYIYISSKVHVWLSTHDAVFPFNQTSEKKNGIKMGFKNPLEFKWNYPQTST